MFSVWASDIVTRPKVGFEDRFGTQSDVRERFKPFRVRSLALEMLVCDTVGGGIEARYIIEAVLP